MANQKVKEIQLGAEVYDVYDDSAMHASPAVISETLNLPVITSGLSPNTNDIANIKVDGNMHKVKDTSALHKYEIAGYTHSIYIDAVNGNDINSGLSPNAPIQTMNKAVELINSGKYAVISFKLMGNNVYTMPSDVRSISGAAPHFSSYNGSPTLRFAPTVGSAGPCFYSCHVNLTGSEQYPLNIESEYGGIYFEHVALSMGYCNVKCNIRVYGGSAHIYDCNFSNSTYHQYASGYYPQVLLQYCNATIDDCSFITDTSHPVCGVYCGVASVVRFYSNNTFSGNGVCVYVDGTTMYATGDVTKTSWRGSTFCTGAASTIKVTGEWNDDSLYSVSAMHSIV